MSSDRNIPGGSDVDPTQPSSSTTNIDNNNNIDDTVNITNALLSSPDAHAAALAMVAAAASRLPNNNNNASKREIHQLHSTVLFHLAHTKRFHQLKPINRKKIGHKLEESCS